MPIAPAPTTTDASQPAANAVAPRSRPANRSLRAILLDRLFEILLLICSRCGAPVHLVALVTETAPIQRILQHIGERHEPRFCIRSGGRPRSF